MDREILNLGHLLSYDMARKHQGTDSSSLKISLSYIDIEFRNNQEFNLSFTEWKKTKTKQNKKTKLSGDNGIIIWEYSNAIKEF